MHAQRCPNCRERNDVSVYVHGQLARCVRCGLRFTVERSAPQPPVVSSPRGEPVTDVSQLRTLAPDEQTLAPGLTEIASTPRDADTPSDKPSDEKPSTFDQRPPAAQRERPPDNLQGQAVPDIPGYTCIELLGRGGMGEVWQARQKSLERLVAIKILSPTLAVEPDFVRRFERESTALAALSHPHIVSVFDRGSANGHWYFIMEYVEGRSLRDRAAEGKLGEGELLRLVAQTARAVDYAHTRGVIHRDLKPENILIDRAGNAKVADFGLAGMSEHGRSSLTMTAVAMGTAHYMAPEQRRDAKNVDGRADLYSLGVMLYELLTQELPIGRFATPSEKLPGLDKRLDEMILKLLEQDPEKRPTRANDVADLIESLIAQPTEPAAEKPSPPPVEVALARPPHIRLRERPPHSVESFVRSLTSSPRRQLLVLAAVVLLALVVAVAAMSGTAPANSEATSARLAADVVREKAKGASVHFGTGPADAVLALGAGWRIDAEALVRDASTTSPERPPRAYLESVRLDFKDAAVEADIVVEEPTRGLASEPPSAELVLYANKDNHLGVRLNFAEDAGFRFFSTPGGKLGKAPTDTPAPVIGQTHHLELFLVNGRASAFVDGKQIASASMSGLENAPVRAALGCVGRCRFTNVKLRGPLSDPPTIAVSDAP